MTKFFKGLTGRPFVFEQTIGDELVQARQAYNAFSLISQPADSLVSQPAETLGDLSLVTSDLAMEDVGKDLNFFCPCPVCQSNAKLFAFEHGINLHDTPLVQDATIQDEGTVSITVGGTVTGLIDFTGDTDDITVELVMGQRYVFSLRGTGAEAVKDTYLEIFDPLNVSLGHDDDGGIGLNSLITITAAVNGTYTIRASSFSNPGDPGLGEYTVDVLLMPAVDTVPSNNTTTIFLNQGTSFGFRETAVGSHTAIATQDTDVYKVHLEAGKFYSFSVAGGYDYENGTTGVPGVGEIDTFLRLINPAFTTVLAQNDDINFPSDASSGFGFLAQTTGDYFLEVRGYGQGTGGNLLAGRGTGGYVIDFREVDLSALNPIDVINWASADNIDTVDVDGVPTAYVYFGAAGENFGETTTGRTYHGWTAKEKAAVMEALLEFAKITGIQYLETADINQAEFRLNTVSGTAAAVNFGAYFYPQDPAFGTQQGIGIFNVNSGGWDKPGVSTQDIPGDQVSLDRGGFSFAVVLHEFGHAHGLAHTHDTGGGSQVLPGVTGPTGSLGIFNLNQGVYSVMSYNDAWQLHPDGPSPFTIAGIDNGWSATLSAFDIATLQQRYGVHAHNDGDNVYTLIDVVDDAFYETIWDSDGTDTIAYGGTLAATIDLTAATIDYSPIGGGAISFLDAGPGAQALRGGFTIAKGVVIENASGGSGNDQIIGNQVANILNGGAGNDNLMGRGGDDTIIGGAGADTAWYDGIQSDYSVSYAFDANGNLVTTVTDLNTASPADSHNPTVRVADEGTDNLTGVELLQFSGSSLAIGNVLVLDENNQVVGAFSTIQAAVDASQDGYTIQIGSGTYVEQVIVNGIDNLTIEAAPNADVIIQAPASLVVTGAHAAAHNGGANVYSVLTVINSLDISINGIQIDGAGAGGSVPTTGPNFTGVFFRNSSGELVGVDIYGVHSPYPGGTTADGYPELLGVQHGTGVVVDNDTLLAFTMTGGSISDFQKNAGRFWGADLDIGGVTVTGGGAQTTGPAQNGFIVDSGTGSIHNNTITAIGYAGPVLAYSVIVFVRGADNLDVTDNVIVGTNGATTDAKVLGVAYYDDNAANNGGHITGNTISFVDTGIDVEGALGGPAIVINGNIVTDIDFTDAFSPSGVYFEPGASLVPIAFNVTGTDVHDYLAGGSAADTLSGAGGDDEFVGNGGNDTLNGGDGVDQATYAGNIADYTIVYEIDGNGNIIGFLSVTDNNAGNGDEGHDTLNSIEAVGFANVVLNASQSVHLFNGATLIGTFDTIQAAIDAAADGNTIRALAGTYTENLNVNKDVTIYGANHGVAGSAARGAETVIDGQVVINAVGVTIDGVSLVGAAAGVLGSTGLVVNAGSDNFSLVNSVLSSNSAADFAIFTAAGMSGLDIGYNLIQGYSIGIYISGGTTAGSVHDNLFQGDGGPFTGLGNGVNSETSHVLIQNNIFDGIYAGVLNLFPFGPDPVDLNSYVIGNIITGSGAERPIQVHPTADSTHIVGTDENEAFYDANFGGPGELMVSLGFDGQGGDDHIYGNSQADEFNGGDGSDRIYGGGGDDLLTGGAGNDLLDGEGGIDTAFFADASVGFTDTVLGWLVTSSEGNDFLQNTEIVVGGGGQRTLLVGATGFGTVQAALTSAANGDIVRLASGNYSGTGAYSASGLTVIAQAGAVQNLTYSTAGTFGITIFAAGGVDHITTGAGDDLIFGGGGADVLNGGDGNDVLYGEGGIDTLIGGLGDDVFIVDNSTDIVIEAIGEGNDSVLTQVSYLLTSGADVELLSTTYHAGTAAIELTGNYGNQTIIGNFGNNVITGGVGADVLIGLAGDDVYIVHDAQAVVVEDAGSGNDIVFTSVSYTLAAGADVETLSTTFHGGTAAIDLTGSDSANTIYGNAGDNVLDGRDGSDILIGFGGADTFAFTTALGAGNVDIIADFEQGVDRIALDDAIFTELGGLGTLSADAFVTGTAAADADDRIIYDAATGQLFYDADGNGDGAAVLFAIVSAGLPLTASDFLVI